MTYFVLLPEKKPEPMEATFIRELPNFTDSFLDITYDGMVELQNENDHHPVIPWVIARINEIRKNRKAVAS